jgi:hypothetical protein
MTNETEQKETNLELEKYKIDKQVELRQQKLDEASSIVVGNLNLNAISLLADKFAGAGDMIPKEFQNNPQKCFAAIYKGASLGLDAFQALQRISVINGRATIWGDTALALVKKSGLLVSFKEEIFESGKMVARCSVQRVGEELHISEFTQQDAELAGLWGNNVWKKYPKRMLKYRARAFALRDVFPDVLDGLYFKEEIEGEGLNDKTEMKVVSSNEIETIDMDQGIEIENLVKKAGLTVEQFNQSQGIAGINHLPLDKFDGVVSRLKNLAEKAEVISDNS